MDGAGCFAYARTMKTGPDISRIAALIGEPARAQMLTALMSGKALTAAELAQEAGVTPQTASSHLAQLTSGGLIVTRKQGRHRYQTLASDEVAHALETLMGLAAGAGHTRTQTGPKEPALRAARSCYRHLAGDAGVQLMDSLLARGLLDGSAAATGTSAGRDPLRLTQTGRAWAAAHGLPDLPARPCLDWSARRAHLAGPLGRALLDHMLSHGWAWQDKGSRVIRFTPEGRRQFERTFPL